MSQANSDIKTYNITANTTTILPGRFILEAIVVNQKGASSNTAAIYDSNETYGANAQRLKATVDTTTSVGRLDYGIPCFDGIYIVTATGTAPNLTVIYRTLV